MLEYFTDKLIKIKKDINRVQDMITSNISSKPIADLQMAVLQLDKHRSRLLEFSNDAAEQLPVSDIIVLLKGELIDKYAVNTYYSYTKAVTLAERDELVRLDWSFKAIQVK